MNKPNNKLAWIGRLALTFFCVFNVSAQSPEEIRGLEILSSARKAIYGENVPKDLSGFKIIIYSRQTIKSELFADLTTIVSNYERFSQIDYLFGDNGKIRISDLFERTTGENSSLNLDLHFINGDEFAQRAGNIIAAKFVPSEFDQRSKSVDSVSDDIYISRVRDIDPISLIFQGAEFKYKGIAEAPEGRADIVTVEYPGYTVDFYFDQKTNYLLMTRKQYEKSYSNGEYTLFVDIGYYSDHQKIGDMTIPTRVKRNHGSQIYSMVDGKKKIRDTYVVFEESVVTAERNVVFPPGIFSSEFDPKELELKRKGLKARWDEK